MKSKTKWLTAIATLAVVFVLVLSLGLSTIFVSADSEKSSDKARRYYGDFTSWDEVLDATEDMNVSLAEEGMVLLKNDGTLPLSKGMRVSVLGIAQDTLNETTGSVSESLKDAGFSVNPTLEEYYLGDGATYSDYGNEPELNASQKNSLTYYSDAAVVVIGRGTPGESDDREIATDEVETETYLGGDQGWAHEAHETVTTDGTAVAYKHEMQLTESEENLIKLAEQSCKKVIVLYTSSNVFEMANLQKDDKINAIAWIGRLGNGDIAAVGEMLIGDINPSGKTVDEWTRDLTNDPTYANVFNTSYTQGEEADQPSESTVVESSYSGVDYEEDIYLGYKFYETYWKEKESDNNNVSIPGLDESNASIDDWYDYNVVYPFGYGLSYTEFSYDLKAVYAGKDGAKGSSDIMSTAEDRNKSITLSDSDLASSENGEANIETLYAEVDVTNVGSVAGKDVVEVYVEAPYGSSTLGEDVESLTGTEKPAWTLVGYAKTDSIKPGATKTVTVAFNVQDFSSYDYSDANGDEHTGYELDKGAYNIHIMQSSSHENMRDDNEAYEVASFSLTDTVYLDLDDFSGNKVDNLFSDPDDDYYSMSMSAATGTMYSPIDAAADQGGSTESTMLSRSDFDGTMPTAPDATIDDTSKLPKQGYLDEDALAKLAKFEGIDADATDENGELVWSDEDEPWYHSVQDLEGWAQGKGVVGDNGMYETILDDMAGVPLYDEKGNVSEEWVEFMNQLTWEEITDLLGQGNHKTIAMATIGKTESKDENGPNQTNDASYRWVGEPTIAATWNTDLCEQYGIMFANLALWQGMTGWYGPGLNTHRSAFSGRNPEYYSQDAVQGGYVAAAVVGGAGSRGINVYIKHFALYDMSHVSESGCVNVSEQNMRENYLKVFQMAMQEGDAHAAMSAFNKIGSVYVGQNYALIQGLARDEWGWTGYIVTDTTRALANMTMDGLIRAGAEIPDSDDYASGDKMVSGTWVDDYDWTDELVAAGIWQSGDTAGTTSSTFAVPEGAVVFGEGESAVVSPTQWYCARMGAMRILYNQVNSAGNNNGITETSITTTATATQGQEFSLNVIPEDVIDPTDHIIGNATITDGTLADGLTFENGVLSGAVLSAEDFSVTLEVVVDGWIKIEVKVSVTNSPIVSMQNDVSSIEVGDTLNTNVLFDSSSIEYQSGYTVSVVDGALPSGIIIESDGHISGTASEVGTYTFTVEVNATTDNDWIVNISPENLEVIMSTYGWTEEQVYTAFKPGGSLYGGQLVFVFGVTLTPAYETYYMTYTIDVAEAADGGSADSGSTESGSSGSGSAGSATGGFTSDELEAAVKAAVEEAMSDLDLGGTTNDESSSGNGLATAGLVLAIIAIVAAAAVLIVVLLRGNNKGGDSKE